MVYQPFFYVHAFNLIDIKVIRARGSCVVIAVYLVFTNLECGFEAELVAFVTFRLPTSQISVLYHKPQRLNLLYLTMTPHAADALWTPSR